MRVRGRETIYLAWPSRSSWPLLPSYVLIGPDDPVERHQHPAQQASLHRHLDLHAGFEAVDVAVVDWVMAVAPRQLPSADPPSMVKSKRSNALILLR